MSTEPVIRPAEAEELCAEVYRSRSQALAVGRQLRAAGWVVIEHDPHPPRRPDGRYLLATVYHPDSYDSPGDLLVEAADPDQ